MTASAMTATDAFRRDFSGVVFTAGEPGYDEARTLFNAMIDKRPAVIAQCRTIEDVRRALQHARETGLEVAIRGGGHGVAGNGLSDGGLVVDLRLMNAVDVDPQARVARVGGGATMSHLDRATQPHNLATTGGRVSTTGVGGFTLGGGNGWLDRKFGLACDNLVSAELVTADGTVLTASETENADLFWGLHGGGGNFGVVTQMTLRLHPLKSVTAALLMWRAERAPEVLRAYRDYIEAAPDEIGGGAIYLTGPELDFVPQELVGQLVFGILVTYVGPQDEARKAMAPILGLSPDAQMLAEMPYAELQCMLDDPPGYRNYWSAEHLARFPDEAVDLFCARAADMIVPSASQHVVFPGGGAVARQTADWPVPWRTAPWCVHPFGLWENAADDARGRQWAQDIKADMRPWATGSVYLNFIGDEGEDRLVAGYGADNYRRLAQIKAKFDPENVFHVNHNIKPAA